jgi:hypothetical protein
LASPDGIDATDDGEKSSDTNPMFDAALGESEIK